MAARLSTQLKWRKRSSAVGPVMCELASNRDSSTSGLASAFLAPDDASITRSLINENDRGRFARCEQGANAHSLRVKRSFLISDYPCFPAWWCISTVFGREVYPPRTCFRARRAYADDEKFRWRFPHRIYERTCQTRRAMIRINYGCNTNNSIST